MILSVMWIAFLATGHCSSAQVDAAQSPVQSVQDVAAAQPSEGRSPSRPADGDGIGDKVGVAVISALVTGTVTLLVKRNLSAKEAYQANRSGWRTYADDLWKTRFGIVNERLELLYLARAVAHANDDHCKSVLTSELTTRATKHRAGGFEMLSSHDLVAKAVQAQRNLLARVDETERQSLASIMPGDLPHVPDDTTVSFGNLVDAARDELGVERLDDMARQFWAKYLH